MKDLKRPVSSFVVCALVLLSGLFLSVPAQAQRPVSNKINFSTTGCKNTGVTSLSQLGEAYPGSPCSAGNYTTGNLGKGWAVLDLVPFHVDLTPMNGAPMPQTYDFVMAFDYAPTLPPTSNPPQYGFDKMGYTD